jgi:hypothetical protein
VEGCDAVRVRGTASSGAERSSQFWCSVGRGCAWRRHGGGAGGQASHRDGRRVGPRGKDGGGAQRRDDDRHDPFGTRRPGKAGRKSCGARASNLGRCHGCTAARARDLCSKRSSCESNIAGCHTSHTKPPLMPHVPFSCHARSAAHQPMTNCAPSTQLSPALPSMRPMPAVAPTCSGLRAVGGRLKSSW